MNKCQTIILVITLGALHGLVIRPVLLTLFHCERDDVDEIESGTTVSPSTERYARNAKFAETCEIEQHGVLDERHAADELRQEPKVSR